MSEWARNFQRLDGARYFLFLAILATLPFGIFTKLNNALIIILFIISLPGIRIKSLTFFVWLMVFFYLLHLVGFFYSENTNQALFELEKKMTFLVFPLIFSKPLCGTKRKAINAILVFGAACLLASVMCFANALYLYLKTDSFKSFFYYDLSDIVGTHPIYLAMFSSFAVLSLVYTYVEHASYRTRIKAVAMLVLAMHLTVFIFLLSARTVIATYMLLCIGSVGYLLLKRKAYWQLLATFTLLITLFSGLIFLFPNNLERFKEAINYKSQYSIDKQWGGRALRLLKWDCSLDVIKSSFLVGVGPGDSQDQLQQCYLDKGYNALTYQSEVRYNAHNQYLQTTIGLGIVGLGVVLALFATLVVWSIRNSDYLIFCFVSLFAICCTTESMLEVHKGIVFFSLFSCLFAETGYRYDNAEKHALDTSENVMTPNTK